MSLHHAPQHFRQALAHGRALATAEFHLARHELGESLHSAGRGLGLLIVSALCGFVTLLSAAVAAGLGLVAAGMPPAGAAALLAFGFAALTALAFWRARRRLSAKALTPTKTLAQIRADIAVMKDVIRA